MRDGDVRYWCPYCNPASVLAASADASQFDPFGHFDRSKARLHGPLGADGPSSAIGHLPVLVVFAASIGVVGALLWWWVA